MVESALIAAVATLIGVGGTVVVAVVSVRSSRSTNQRTLEAAREGQLADRYSKAVDQLGSNQVGVRRGGIYALEGIALDSPRNHPIVMEVLTAFIREHSGSVLPPDSAEQRQGQVIRPDVQAAITVVGRRDAKRDIRPMDVAGANLYGADLANADLHGADLHSAILYGADLTGADLHGANLGGADLHGANLDGANFDGAALGGARWSRIASPPPGWELTSSGRLRRRGSGAAATS